MLHANNLIGFGVDNHLPSIEFINSYSSTGGESITLSGVSIGAASNSRLVVVGLGLHNGTTSEITSVTIGGVTATAHAFSTDERLPIGLYYASVPTGTTADIHWEGAGGIDYYSCGVWVIRNYRSATPAESLSQANGVPLSENTTGHGACIALAGCWLSQSGKVWTAPFTQSFYSSPQGTLSGAVHIGAPATATINFTAGGYNAENLVVLRWI